MKQLTILKGQPPFPTEQADFRIQWMIDLEDSRSLRLLLSATATNRMSSYSIRLLPAPGTQTQPAAPIVQPRAAPPAQNLTTFLATLKANAKPFSAFTAERPL